MNVIDRFLNGITTYRLVLYGLMVIALAAVGLSLTGKLSYSPFSLVMSLAVIVTLGYLVNKALAAIFKAPAGIESGLITSLILFLIIKPPVSLPEFAFAALAVYLAMASKYLLAAWDRHIFNPAAAGLVVIGLMGSGQVFWWVGCAALLVVVAVVGLLVVRKTRRFQMFLAFATMAGVTYALFHHLGLGATVKATIVSGPLIFFGTIMLTEPLTTPPNGFTRIVYGVIVGVLYGSQFSLGVVSSSPEIALVAGNLLSYAVSYKRRVQLELVGKTQLAGGVYQLAFAPTRSIAFSAGQYMEWTLPHPRADSRGNRRYFTLASSPGETQVKLGVRFDPQHASSFKRALMGLAPGGTVSVTQLAGDFILPEDPDQRLVFIAGGIGITPFRSMVQHLMDSDEKRDITLFYTALRPDDFAYRGLFDAAQRVGVKTHYVVTGKEVPTGWSGLTGFLTADIIKQQIPNYETATYYLSGPNALVQAYRKEIRGLGVGAAKIRTDYFPGF